MAELGYDFNASEYGERESFEPIPEAYYLAEIIEADLPLTKDGTGRRFTATFKVIEGEYEGRRVWAGINIENQNPQAQDIGQKEFAELLRACGVVRFRSTEDVLGASCVIHVKIEPKRIGKDGREYDARNNIKEYLPANADNAPAPAQKPAGAPQRQAPATRGAPAPANGPARPWGGQRAS